MREIINPSSAVKGIAAGFAAAVVIPRVINQLTINRASHLEDARTRLSSEGFLDVTRDRVQGVTKVSIELPGLFYGSKKTAVTITDRSGNYASRVHATSQEYFDSGEALPERSLLNVAALNVVLAARRMQRKYGGSEPANIPPRHLPFRIVD